MKIVRMFMLLLVFDTGILTAQPLYNRADSATVFSLIDKAEKFFNENNYDSAFYYCKKAETISLQKNFKKGQAYALIEAGDIYIDKDELGKADANAVVVNNIGMQLKDSQVIAVSWMQMAQVKMYTDQFEEAAALFGKSRR